LWLSSLPTSRPPVEAGEIPEGISLTGEAGIVIAFLDDCLQRCLKTPYRYIEEMQSLYGPETEQSDPGGLPSPLLMTALQQLGAKVASKVLLPAHTLALASFLRRLVFRLSALQHDLSFLRQIATKIDGILASESLFSQYPIVSGAILRQVKIMRSCLQHTHSHPDLDLSDSRVFQLENFLRRIEDHPIRSYSLHGVKRYSPTSIVQLMTKRLVWQLHSRLLTGLD
jgi:nucleolar pre-ribosomal-associated protein 1